MITEDFYNLTPDVIFHLVESLGLHPTGHCFALNSLENRVYSVKLEWNENIVVKFYRPGRWTKEQILEEHEFLFDLQENEVPVCAPKVFQGKSLFEKAGIYCTIWNRTGGQAPEELSTQELQMLGRYLGRLHNVGASKYTRYRRKLNSDTYGRIPLNLLLDKGFIPVSLQKRYTEVVSEICEIYESFIGNEPLIRIHGDCHKGNILKGEEGWFFLDFDDFLIGPAVQDIWMVLPPQNAEGLLARDALLSGYREFREFNESSLRLIEVLRSLRYIHYSAWIAKRWDDPSFPNAFPHFGGEEYWTKEIKDLEVQLGFVYGDETFSSTDSPVETKEELPLTNKDFFWDM